MRDRGERGRKCWGGRGSGGGLERYRMGPQGARRAVRKAWFPVHEGIVDVSVEKEARQRSWAPAWS